MPDQVPTSLWLWGAAVALVSSFLTKLVDALIEYMRTSAKAKKEKARAEEEKAYADREKIGQATLALLEVLASFRHWTTDDIAMAAGCEWAIQAYSLLQVKHFAWEHMVYPLLVQQGRNAPAVSSPRLADLTGSTFHVFSYDIFRAGYSPGFGQDDSRPAVRREDAKPASSASGRTDPVRIRSRRYSPDGRGYSGAAC